MQKIYKKLPHIDTFNHYQFVTFRTYDSLDDYLKKIDSCDLPMVDILMVMCFFL